MSVAVVFDIATDRVVSYIPAVNTPDYNTRSDVIINPNLSLLLDIIATKYWKHVTGAIVEMTAGEKATVDSELATEDTEFNRDQAIAVMVSIDGVGVKTRGLVQLISERDNYLTNRIIELQDALNAVKVTTGSAQNMRDAIPSTWSTTNTRSKAATIVAYVDDINAGNQDT
jgi:hypothetical protein